MLSFEESWSRDARTISTRHNRSRRNLLRHCSLGAAVAVAVCSTRCIRLAEFDFQSPRKVRRSVFLGERKEQYQSRQELRVNCAEYRNAISCVRMATWLTIGLSTATVTSPGCCATHRRRVRTCPRSAPRSGVRRPAGRPGAPLSRDGRTSSGSAAGDWSASPAGSSRAP